MHGLPESTDLLFFVGSRLELVCSGKYQIFLHFSNGILVTVEGTLSVNDKLISGRGGAHVELMRLLEMDVSQAQATSNSSVVLTFSNGSLLELQDSNEKFESYSISAPDRPTLFV